MDICEWNGGKHIISYHKWYVNVVFSVAMFDYQGVKNQLWTVLRFSEIMTYDLYTLQ